MAFKISTKHMGYVTLSRVHAINGMNVWSRITTCYTCRYVHTYCISGTFDDNFNVMIWQIFLQSPNLSHH